MSDAGIDSRGIANLEVWLTARIVGADRVRLATPQKLSGGYSADTILLEATTRRGSGETGERYVLRRETPEPAVYPQQATGLDVEIEVQFRAMDALARHSRVPLAPLVGLERDSAVIGAPFFVMGFVDGSVPATAPPYPAAGFFAEAKPEQRARLIEDGLRVLAEIHAVDWRAAGLGWLAPSGVRPGLHRQLSLWEDYAERELAGRVHPLMSEARAWLRANQPRDEELVLSWGDSRIGNMIWRDFRCVCITDFENVAIAPRAFDLGWWLMFDRWSHDAMGSAARLPGEPTREQQREHYERCAGVRVGDTHYWELLAAWRYCAIVVRIMNRAVARGEMPAEQRVWLENPATVCLAALMNFRP